MDSRRIRNLRNSFDRNIVDKQVDKIFETGRQFVEGVSGARPGKRRNSDFQGITSKSVKKVGRWVSEKVDLFFDEENDDWNDENFYDDNSDIKTFSRESNSYESAKQHSKRPLEAISLRQPKNLQTTEQKKLPYVKRVRMKIGQMKWISKLKDGKELQKMRIILREINQSNKFNQNQEIFPDQEEEEYSLVNSLIPE